MHDDSVVGREAELTVVEGLLDGVVDSPAVLVLAGEAGIGKTTLWQAGVEAARACGFTVLAAHDRLPEARDDRARTLLALGRHQRRGNQRRNARVCLGAAAWPSTRSAAPSGPVPRGRSWTSSASSLARETS